jgi:hypothetical protein
MRAVLLISVLMVCADVDENVILKQLDICSAINELDEDGRSLLTYAFMYVSGQARPRDYTSYLRLRTDRGWWLF